MTPDKALKGIVQELASAIRTGNPEVFNKASSALMMRAHIPEAKDARELYAAHREAMGWERSKMTAMKQVLIRTGLATFER